jgi:small subunit ribosomal protein S6
MFILDSNRYARDPAGVSGQIAQLVADCGGEMLASRLWEERRLAYPIRGHRKGTYWLTYFRMDSVKMERLNRQCKLNDTFLRQLFVRLDPRIADALVRHAREGVMVPAAAPAAAPAENMPLPEEEVTESA